MNDVDVTEEEIREKLEKDFDEVTEQMVKDAKELLELKIKIKEAK